MKAKNQITAKNSFKKGKQSQSVRLSNNKKSNSAVKLTGYIKNKTLSPENFVITAHFGTVTGHLETVSPENFVFTAHFETVSGHLETISSEKFVITAHFETVSGHFENVSSENFVVTAHLETASGHLETISPENFVITAQLETVSGHFETVSSENFVITAYLETGSGHFENVSSENFVFTAYLETGSGHFIIISSVKNVQRVPLKLYTVNNVWTSNCQLSISVNKKEKQFVTAPKSKVNFNRTNDSKLKAHRKKHWNLKKQELVISKYNRGPPKSKRISFGFIFFQRNIYWCFSKSIIIFYSFYKTI
jgi:hypothetical protein